MADTRNVSAERSQLVFIYPLIYRPQKVNVAVEFKRLSEWYRGHIFALSGAKQRSVDVFEFEFHSERYPTSAPLRFLMGLWIQMVVPLRLLWNSSPVVAVVAYDPYRSGVAALALKVLLGSKMIVQLNGDYHRTEPSQRPGLRRLMGAVLKFVMRRTDAIKVLNADQEQYCRITFPDVPVFRFPAFVATDYFMSLESYQGDYLLSVGHPYDLKGMDVLIKAFKQISHRHPGISLRIMGYCSSEERTRYAELVGRSEAIHFINPGWVEDVGEQMRGCLALVNAAYTEAMGRVHVEAMSCAKPIVATLTNGGRECVVDGETGLLCRIGDVDDLAAKLEAILSDRARAERMGKAGLDRVLREYSETVCALSFRAMVDRVTGNCSELAT